MDLIKKVLAIAGSDCSGGAGIQADIKTVTVHGMYAMSVITALTAQNTTGVYDVAETAPAFVGRQIDCVFEDIRPDAVKIGMVANSGIIKTVAQKLLYYKAENIVVDTIMAATSGGNMLKSDAVHALATHLFPLASVVTPNIPEAEVLCGFRIQTKADMEKAAKVLLPKTGGAVLIKGGHLQDTADDLLATDSTLHWFSGERIQTKNTHGTGCTLSSAIACNLAAGNTITQSVANAKTYVTGTLKAGLNLGKGNGPLLHTYNLQFTS